MTTETNTTNETQYQYEVEYILEHEDGTTEYSSLWYPNVISYDAALKSAETYLDKLNIPYAITQVYESPMNDYMSLDDY